MGKEARDRDGHQEAEGTSPVGFHHPPTHLGAHYGHLRSIDQIYLVQVTRIELVLPAWQAGVQPVTPYLRIHQSAVEVPPPVIKPETDACRHGALSQADQLLRPR